MLDLMSAPDRARAEPGPVLVVNSGSSSVKFAIFSGSEPQERLLSGAVERIGRGDGQLRVDDGSRDSLMVEQQPFRDHTRAIGAAIEAVTELFSGKDIVAAGHRVVHGGPECDCAKRITPTLEAELRRFVSLAPLHQPHNLAGIEAVRSHLPDLPQIACFDTAFHQGRPRLSTLTGLPRALHDSGIRRYGFHGLAFEYVVEELRARGVNLASEKIVLAHLGGGASMCALSQGKSVETTTGFSTLAGLPMSTRPGDLDPGIVLHLMKELGWSVEDVEETLYNHSGLLGLSGTSSDVRDLLSQGDSAAKEAIDYFCYQCRRQLAGLTAALGGLDRVVFSGGIGANSAEIRLRICTSLAYLGIALDERANHTGARLISSDAGSVAVEVSLTDEELMIARHVRRELCKPTLREDA